MIEEISLNRFRDLFKEYNRENQFSFEGLEVLYNYLEDLEDFKVDIIGLCCDFCEYNNIEDFFKDYYESLEDRKNEFIEDNDLKNEFKEEIEEYKEKKDFDEWFKFYYEEDFFKEIEEEIENKTLLLKIGNDLNGGFIIQKC